MIDHKALSKSEQEFLAESNCIEGYCYMPEKYLLDDGSEGRLLPNKFILNSIEAWRYIRANINKQVDHSDIQKLHALQMNGLMRDQRMEGVYRTGKVTVFGAKTVDYTEIMQLLTYFMQNFNKIGSKTGKPEQNRLKNGLDAEELHYLFECIHPFWDGNGRVGRLLYAWSLLRGGNFVRRVLADVAPEHASFGQARGIYFDKIQQFREKRLPGIREACKLR